jgi:hypothetical protein
VYQYDGKTAFVSHLPCKTKIREENSYSVSTPFVKSKNGTVWFGTYGVLIGYNGSAI